MSWNPGNLKTELQRHTDVFQRTAMRAALYPAKLGAYTELYAACSPDVTVEDGGAFIAPWGRKFEPRLDIKKGLKGKDEGGSAVGAQFWDWCEKTTKEFQ